MANRIILSIPKAMQFKIGIIVIIVLCAINAIAQPQVDIPASLTLDQAVELALARNQDIVSAQKEVEKAKATVREARSAALPQLNLQADALHLVDADKVYSGEEMSSEQYSISATLNQAVSTFGRVSNALRGAKLYVQLAESKLAVTKQAVTFQITKAFYDVLLAKQLVAVNQEALEIAQSHFRSAQLRYEQGVGSEFEMLRAQVRVANLEPGLIAANNNLVLAKQNFNTLLNIPPEQPIELIGELVYTDYLPNSETAWEVAQRNRPDLLILKQMQQIAEVQLNYYKAGYRPNLYLVGNVTDQQVKYGYYPNDWITSWYAGLSFQLPLFDGFKTAAQIQGAKAELEKARTALTKGLLSAQVEVKQTCLRIQEARAIVVSAEEAVKLADRALTMAKISFENGRASTLDVADAQLALTTAKTNFAQAVHGYQVALAKLKLDIGLDKLP
ncbi:MAG: TolC family protein [bacterium]|nr:TolC family protein [bacterium]